MNKKLLILLLSICTIAFWSSCVDDDDDYVIDEEWKAYQDDLVAKVAANSSGYNNISSNSNNGNIYLKEITDFVPDKAGDQFDRTLSPLFTDSVYVHYEGWYYKLDGDSIIFDTTEGTNANGYYARFKVNGLTDGFATALQNMTEGQQKLVCIPQKLGYGAYGSGSIPGYTTLWFKIKLKKVKKAGIDF